MVTFTLPFELRDTTYQHQGVMYDLLFKASVEALQTIGKNKSLWILFGDCKNMYHLAVFVEYVTMDSCTAMLIRHLNAYN